MTQDLYFYLIFIFIFYVFEEGGKTRSISVNLLSVAYKHLSSVNFVSISMNKTKQTFFCIYMNKFHKNNFRTDESGTSNI